MKGLKIILFISVYFFIASSLFADIYEWTDAKGVRHFTNYAPPDNAKLMMKTETVPYDEAADIERMEAEQQEELEIARQKIAEREADLERRIAEAERRLAELDRQTERPDREAEEWSDEAGDDPYIDRSNQSYGRRYVYSPGYYITPYKGRKYYRGNYGGIYYKKRYYKTYHRYRHYKKHHYGHHKKPFFKKRYIPRHHFQYDSKQRHGKHRYLSQGRRHDGRRHFNRGHAGFSRRSGLNTLR